MVDNRFKVRHLASTLVISLLFLNVLQLNISPILVVGANSPSSGVHQRVLIITRSGYDNYINTIINYVKNSGLGVDVLYVDTTEITNSTFYSGNDGKYSMIHINGYAKNYINDVEWSYISSYEAKFNITESSVYAPLFTNKERYGIQDSGSYVDIENVTFVANNLRIEFKDPARGSFTTVWNLILFNNVTVYAFAGNMTCNIPFLWSYTDDRGVTRIGCSQVDKSPLYNKMWYYLPFMLSATLSKKNILLKAFVAYDIDDINGVGYGRNPNENEALEIVEFYKNYSMPFSFFFMQIFDGPLNPSYKDFYNVVRNNRDALRVYLHPSLGVDYKRIETGMKLLYDEDLVADCLYYIVPGGHQLVNSSVVQYLYENCRIRSVAQASTQICPSNWYSEYSNMWLSVRVQFAPNTDTLEGLWSARAGGENYAQWCFMNLLFIPYFGCEKLGGYILLWSHYAGFRNEQPVLKALRDIVFELGIYPIVPVCTEQIALTTRTIGINGGHKLTNPIYYEDEGKLIFSLVSKGTAPDDICGLMLPSNQVSMNDAILIVSNAASSFVLFRYEAGKQYTIYLNVQESNVHLTNTNAWITSSSFIYNKSLSFTVEAPYTVMSTTKVYCRNLGKPLQVEGAESWSYDSQSKILTIHMLHSNSKTVTITVSWVKVSFTSIKVTDGTGVKELVNRGTAKVYDAMKVWINLTFYNYNCGISGANLYTKIYEEDVLKDTSDERYVMKGSSSTDEWYTIRYGPATVSFKAEVWWNSNGTHYLEDAKYFNLTVVKLFISQWTPSSLTIEKGKTAASSWSISFGNGGNDYMYNTKISLIDSGGLDITPLSQDLGDLSADGTKSTSFSVKAPFAQSVGLTTLTFRISYDDFRGVYHSETKTAFVNVTKLGTTLTINAPSTATQGKPSSISATLKDSNGNPIQGETIIFKIIQGAAEEPVGSDDTDSNGVATIVYNPLKAGEFKVKATYSGSSNYGASTSLEANLSVAIDYTPYIIIGLVIVAAVIGSTFIVHRKKQIHNKTKSSSLI